MAEPEPPLWEQHADWWQREFTDGVDAEYEEQIIPLSATAPVDEVVLWFTELAPVEDGRFSAGVEQVSILGVANPNG